MEITEIGFNLAMPSTIDEFKRAVDAICGVGDHQRTGTVRENVYILVEDEISDKLRGEIFALAPNGSLEPMRAAMHAMGYTWW